ncbi:MAG: hypothetical protein KA716_15015 [Gloeotrichia echinulata DEX184]|nr:hypothetical protein [Gloeotrichia echinulata DEX184]
MSPLTSPNQSAETKVRSAGLNYVLLLSLLVISVTPISSVFAHKVKIAADVGATLHIEPNDNPRAGEPAKTWFALTRKGGKVIPLKECNCKLAVYAEPHTPGEPALLEPSLKPVTAERYQGTPGTEITFPKPGAYQLQLTGKPATGASFKPFELKFEVTVAAGSSVESIPQNIQNVNKDVGENKPQQIPLWAIALPIVAIIGISFAVVVSKRVRS